MAKALATEGGLNFLSVKGPELFSKWVGESEKAVREIFKKARNSAPSIIFFDEIDSLAVERGNDEGNSVGDRVLSQLLSEMDGIDPLVNVIIVAATNRPEMIDKALMRPGRIDRILYVGLPDFESRIEIFKIRLSKMSHNELEINLNELSEKSDGYSGAEIASVCTTAGYLAMEENIEAERIEMKHLIKALEKVKPRTTKEMLEFYQNFQQK
jgi:SpoVK/Ycf46/Vps4 family AAA+-type ATPase